MDGVRKPASAGVVTAPPDVTADGWFCVLNMFMYFWIREDLDGDCFREDGFEFVTMAAAALMSKLSKVACRLLFARLLLSFPFKV